MTHALHRKNFVPDRRVVRPDTHLRLGDYTIRAGGPADRDAILATFNRVFAEEMPDFRPRTAEEWDWAFANNPAGTNIWIAAADDGTVCAQFAGIPIRVLAGEKEVVLSHIVDSFTHPEHRRGLKRPGLFASVVHAFCDAILWPDQLPTFYGFPLPAPYRLGVKVLGYEVVRTVLQQWSMLDWPLPADEGGTPEVTEVARFDHEVRPLFDRCHEARFDQAIRDDVFLNWRYADHPSAAYRFAVVRGDGGLRGLAVYRGASFSEVPQGLLMEWLVPPDDTAAARALIAWAREQARSDGLDRIGTLLAPIDPWWTRLPALGFRVVPTKYILVTGMLSRDRRFDEDRLRTRWRYTLGEADLA